MDTVEECMQEISWKLSLLAEAIETRVKAQRAEEEYMRKITYALSRVSTLAKNTNLPTQEAK